MMLLTGRRCKTGDLTLSSRACDGLGGVYRGRRTQNYRIHVVQRQAFVEAFGDMADAILERDLSGSFPTAADQRNHFDAVDQPQGIKVFEPKGAHAGQRDFDAHATDGLIETVVE